MTAGIDVDPAERKATADGFNINGLKRLDGAVTSVLVSASHVVLYELKEDLNQWGRCDVEGALFLVQLDTNHPSNTNNIRYRLFIINRKSLDNYVDDVLVGNEDMDYSEKMIMYRNSKAATVGIWFYEQQEADQFHSFLKKIIGGDSAPSASPTLSTSINAPESPPAFQRSLQSASLPASTPSAPPVPAPTIPTSGPAQVPHSRPKRPPRRSTKPQNQVFNSDRRDMHTGHNSRSRREPRRDPRSSFSSPMTKPNGTTPGASHPPSRRDAYAAKRSLNANVPHTSQASATKTVLSSNKSQSSKTPHGKIQSSTKGNPAPRVVKSHTAAKPKVDDSLARLFPDLSITEASSGATLPAGAPESAIFESDAVSTMIKAPVPSAFTSETGASSTAKASMDSITAVPMTPAMDEAIIVAAPPIQPTDEPAQSTPKSTSPVSAARPAEFEDAVTQGRENAKDKSAQTSSTANDDDKADNSGSADVVEVVDIAPKVKPESESVMVHKNDAIRDTKSPRNVKRFNRNEKHSGGSRIESQDHSNFKQAEQTFKRKMYEDDKAGDVKEGGGSVKIGDQGANTESGESGNENAMMQGPPLVGLSHGGGIGGGVGLGIPGMGMGMGMGMGVGMGMGMPPRGTMGMDDNGMPLPMLSGMGIPHGVHPLGGGGTFGGMHPQMAMVMHQQHQQHQQQQNMMMMHHIMQQQRHMQQLHGVASPASSPIAPGVMPPPQLVRPGLNLAGGNAPPPGGVPPSSMIGHSVEVGRHVLVEPGANAAGKHGEEPEDYVEEGMAHSVAHAHKNGYTGTNPNAPLDRSAFRAVVQRMLTDRKLFDRVYEHFNRNVRER